MKIVQINTVCGTGSTGKITVALHNLATKNHHESYIAYGRNSAPPQIPTYKIGNKADFYFHVLVKLSYYLLKISNLAKYSFILDIHY